MANLNLSLAKRSTPKPASNLIASIVIPLELMASISAVCPYYFIHYNNKIESILLDIITSFAALGSASNPIRYLIACICTFREASRSGVSPAFV